MFVTEVALNCILSVLTFTPVVQIYQPESTNQKPAKAPGVHGNPLKLFTRFCGLTWAGIVEPPSTAMI